MIPKKIHYCWFGKGELSPAMKSCIASWKKYCPDYEIIQWNEDSFDVNSIPFTKAAYEAGKWAFVSDYARLKIVYENGGIYLDTDVELLQSLDKFLDFDGYMGFQTDALVNTGLGFGSVAGHGVLRALMEDYEKRSFPRSGDEIANTACPIINTKVLEEYGFLANGEHQIVDNFALFPAEYFDPKDNQTYILNLSSETVSIHHYDASWKGSNTKLKHALFSFVGRLIGRDNFIKLKKIIKK